MRFLRLGSAGMRGEIGSGLTPALAIDFSSAMGTYLRGGRILVAADTRFSSTMLSHAVISALLSCGCEVINSGIASAPELHFSTKFMNADGALLLGAGHHPAGWNAIVPVSEAGAYLNSVRQQELLDIYHSRRYAVKTWDKIGRETELPASAGEAYLDMLCSKIDTEAIADGKFKVVADFCNGSGSKLARSFASRLGIEMIAINDIFSGILPHDPEPRPRSSAQVQSVLKPLGAHAGFVFNSDMSRAAVVTSAGETLSEEYTFPLVADHILSKCPHPASVVSNWCTTRTLDDIVARHGGNVCKTKVGQSYIIDRMQEISAELAGDGSGSVALRDSVPGFDSFMAMAMILEAMALEKRTSAELAEELPRYHIVKKKVYCPSANAYSLLRSLKNQFPDAELSEEDGFRFDWKDGWVHLRASNTEPVIRMIVEWKGTQEAIDRALHVRGLLERLVAS